MTMFISNPAWVRLRTIGSKGVLVLALIILGGIDIPCMAAWLDWLLPPLRNPCPNHSLPVNFSLSTQTTYTPRFTWGLLAGGQETHPLSSGATPFYGLGQTGSVPITPLIVFPRGEGVRYLTPVPLYGSPVYGYLCVPSGVPRVWSLPGWIGNGYGGIPGSIVLPAQPTCSPKSIHSWSVPLPGPAYGQRWPNGTGIPHGQGLPSGKGMPNGGLGPSRTGVSSAEGGGFAASGLGGAYSVPVPSAPGPAAPAFGVPLSPAPAFPVPGSAGPGARASAPPGIPGSGGPPARESGGPISAGPTGPGSGSGMVPGFGVPGSPSGVPVPQPAGSPVEERAGSNGRGSLGSEEPPRGGQKDFHSGGSRSVSPSPPTPPQNSPLLNAPENPGEPASSVPLRPPLVPIPAQTPFERPTGSSPGKPHPKHRTT